MPEPETAIRPPLSPCRGGPRGLVVIRGAVRARPRRLREVPGTRIGSRGPGRNAPIENRRARPAILRSMSFYDTCVAQRYRNGPTGRRRLTGAEALELEGMDPCYIDIDGFWPWGADSKGLEGVPIAN